MFQAAEEETINEVKPIGSVDMKSGMNYGQEENYDGMTILFLHSDVR